MSRRLLCTTRTTLSFPTRRSSERVARVDRNAMARPRPETGFDPVEWPLRAIGRHRFAQDRRARLALLGGKLVEPLDVLIGQVGKDASHDILISYHDIMSNSDRKSTRLNSSH